MHSGTAFIEYQVAPLLFPTSWITCSNSKINSSPPSCRVHNGGSVLYDGDARSGVRIVRNLSRFSVLDS